MHLSNLSLSSFIMTFIKKACSIWLACLFILFFLVVEKAISAEPYEENAWLSLLHYKKTVEGYESTIKDPAFFLRPFGGHDPKSEYTAISTMLDEVSASDNKNRLCKFPARTKYVADYKKIPFDALSCEEVRYFVNGKIPDSVSIVYASPSIKSATSLFGHTFIRFSSKSNPTVLDLTMSYAANTKNASTISLLWNGLSGGFSGEFNTSPFYRKLSGYNNLEDRDLWEFHLNLPEKSSELLVLHAYELSRIVTPYYFLDDNCAGVMLDVLNSGIPSELPMPDGPSRIRFWTTPLDTIHFLNDRKLIDTQHFRPSLVKQLDFQSETLDEGAIENAFQDLLKGHEPVGGVSDEDNKLIWTLLEYRLAKLEISQEDFKRVSERLRGTPDVYVPPPVSPLLSHKSSMFQVGGRFNDSHTFLDVMIKPTYHSISDPSFGFPRGMSLDFLSVEVSLDTESFESKLTKLDVLNIHSLVPSRKFHNELSWRMHVAFDRETLDITDRRLSLNSLLGLGVSTDSYKNSIVTGLLTLRARTDGMTTEISNVNVGANLGIYALKLGDAEFTTDFQVDFDNKLTSVEKISIQPTLTYRYTANRAIGLSALLEDDDTHHPQITTSVHYKIYF